MGRLPVIMTFLLLLPVVSGFRVEEKPMKPIDYGSKVKFTIKNFGIIVGGSFKGLEGTVLFDPENLNQSQIDVSVDASTINTGLGVRDTHLKGSDYFNIKDHPRIRFRSVKVDRDTKGGNYLMKGLLTIKSFTREITFPFNVTSLDGGFLFTGTFTLNRMHYGLGGTSISLSDNLAVSLQILTTQ
jgi:polyisoprenoid-binding protein YceI